MRNLSVIALTLIFSLPLRAQEQAPERPVDFNFSEEGPEVKFSPVLPALMQKAGAPAAYWEYFWEFGDGSFSREEHPAHSYERPGEYIASLDATAHYDDGKKPKKKKSPWLHRAAPGGWPVFRCRTYSTRKPNKPLRWPPIRSRKRRRN